MANDVWSDPRPTSPEPSPPPTSSPPDDGFEVFDDFTATSIEPGRWRIAGPGSIFSAAGGALAASFPAEGEQTLTARLPRAVDGVRFTFRMTRSSGGSSGGVYVIVVGSDGQQRRIVLGPDTRSEEPGFGVESCPTPSCDRDVDYAADDSVRLGDTYRVQIVTSPERTETTIQGFTQPTITPGLAGVQEVRIYGQSTDAASFEIQIDDLEVRPVA